MDYTGNSMDCQYFRIPFSQKKEQTTDLRELHCSVSIFDLEGKIITVCESQDYTLLLLFSAMCVP